MSRSSVIGEAAAGHVPVAGAGAHDREAAVDNGLVFVECSLDCQLVQICKDI